jgi:hypothetical protein
MGLKELTEKIISSNLPIDGVSKKKDGTIVVQYKSNTTDDQKTLIKNIVDSYQETKNYEIKSSKLFGTNLVIFELLYQLYKKDQPDLTRPQFLKKVDDMIDVLTT